MEEFALPRSTTGGCIAAHSTVKISEVPSKPRKFIYPPVI